MQILVWNQLSEDEQVQALSRAPQNRSASTRETVAKILGDVRTRGDEAVRELTRQLDGVDVPDCRLTNDEWESAISQVDHSVRQAIDAAYENIWTFHVAGKPQDISVETVPGVVCQARYVGINRVGLYAPGGATPLPSSVLMMGVPACIAGCQQVVLCTSPSSDGSISPAIAYAARRCGVQSIFRIGGAQAIAAMAYGTDSVPACDKLFGPGSVWVTEAKRQVAADDTVVTIDMAAGPSEVMVVADGNADPGFVAVDMAAQMEHGRDSQALLLTTCTDFAGKVAHQLDELLSTLTRAEMVGDSMEYTRAIIVEDLDQAIDIANRYAAEHLIIQTRDPQQWMPGVTAAGSVFLGPWTPEVLGDYCSGTNHVLPTCGLARSVNGLSVADFTKRITVQQATTTGLSALGATARRLALAEGLTAHALAVSMREEKIASGSLS